MNLGQALSNASVSQNAIVSTAFSDRLSEQIICANPSRMSPDFPIWTKVWLGQRSRVMGGSIPRILLNGRGTQEFPVPKPIGHAIGPVAHGKVFRLVPNVETVPALSDE
jgi:hypothetical protein